VVDTLIAATTAPSTSRIGAANEDRPISSSCSTSAQPWSATSVSSGRSSASVCTVRGVGGRRSAVRKQSSSVSRLWYAASQTWSSRRSGTYPRLQIVHGDPERLGHHDAFEAHQERAELGLVKLVSIGTRRLLEFSPRSSEKAIVAAGQSLVAAGSSRAAGESGAGHFLDFFAPLDARELLDDFFARDLAVSRSFAFCRAATSSGFDIDDRPGIFSCFARS